MSAISNRRRGLKPTVRTNKYTTTTWVDYEICRMDKPTPFLLQRYIRSMTKSEHTGIAPGTPYKIAVYLVIGKVQIDREGSKQQGKEYWQECDEHSYFTLLPAHDGGHDTVMWSSAVSCCAIKEMAPLMCCCRDMYIT